MDRSHSTRRWIAVVLLSAVLASCRTAPEPDAGPDPDAANAARADGETLAVKRLVTKGAAAWRSCQACHCTTDPRVAADEDWVRLNQETTCIAQGAPAPELRASILAYLRDTTGERPLLIEGSRKRAGDGQIAVPAAGGSVRLVRVGDASRADPDAPREVRLVWARTDDEKYVSAPKGEYRIANFWHYARRGDERWMVSGTIEAAKPAQGGPTLDVDPEAPAFLELDRTLHAVFTITPTDTGAHRIALLFRDANGTQVSLSRNGRLVVPSYRIRNADGDTVAEGAFAPT